MLSYYKFIATLWIAEVFSDKLDTIAMAAEYLWDRSLYK